MDTEKTGVDLIQPPHWPEPRKQAFAHQQAKRRKQLVADTIDVDKAVHAIPKPANDPAQTTGHTHFDITEARHLYGVTRPPARYRSSLVEEVLV